MSHPNYPDFDSWWLDVLATAEMEELPVNDDDPNSYRVYFDDGFSPLDALIEDAGHG